MNFYRDEKKRVFLQVYCEVKKRAVKLPRDKSRHLDRLDDKDIQKIIDAKMSGNLKLLEGEPVRKHLAEWLKYIEMRGLDRSTIQQHERYIENLVFKFFSGINSPDPKSWSQSSIRFYNWMEAEAVSPSVIKAANVSFTKFYKWLAEEGHVPAVKLQIRRPVTKYKHAVLPRPVLPDEVLAWARECKCEHVKLVGLLGYFFSLRPQEVFGLMASDFQVGTSVSNLECNKFMRDAELFDRMSVFVNRQKQNSGNIVNSAKKGSNGWVACFEIEAAKLIIEICKPMKPTEKLIKWNNAKVYDDWRLYGMEDLAIKDMRRASLYYLGHHSKLTIQQLMKHARHKNQETTQLYCRTPIEIVEASNTTWDLGV